MITASVGDPWVGREDEEEGEVYKLSPAQEANVQRCFSGIKVGG